MRLCAFDGCGRRRDSRGYCAQHAFQLRATGVLLPIQSRAEAARANLKRAQDANRRPKVRLVCQHCARSFQVFPSYARNGRRFCSRACGYAYMRGPNGAGALVNLRKPRIPWNKGKGDASRRVPAYVNRSADGPIDRWRLSVYHRDGFCCQRCGDGRGRNLRAHHIIPWAEDEATRFELFNGVTLCSDCHKRLHAGRATCSICGRVSSARRLCGKHYLRWQRYGDPLVTKRRIGRLWQVVKDDK